MNSIMRRRASSARAFAGDDQGTRYVASSTVCVQVVLLCALCTYYYYGRGHSPYFSSVQLLSQRAKNGMNYIMFFTLCTILLCHSAHRTFKHYSNFLKKSLLSSRTATDGHTTTTGVTAWISLAFHTMHQKSQLSFILFILFISYRFFFHLHLIFHKKGQNTINGMWLICACHCLYFWGKRGHQVLLVVIGMHR